MDIWRRRVEFLGPRSCWTAVNSRLDKKWIIRELYPISYGEFIIMLTLFLRFLPSLFMPTSTHLRRRQARHWFRWVLSTKQAPSLLALQTYWRFRRMERYNVKWKEENSQQIWSPNVPIEWVKTRNLAFLSKENQKSLLSDRCLRTLKNPAHPSHAKMP